MKTLIAYATKYGATRECAERISEKLPGEVALHDLEKSMDVDLTPYDSVVIGCSVYMGKPRKPVRKFCETNLRTLLGKRVGLYMCCIQDIKKSVLQQFELAYPKQLMQEAAVLGRFGGVVDFTKLKPFDRIIMNMIAGDLRKKTGNDVVSTLSEDEISAFAKVLAEGATEQKSLL